MYSIKWEMRALKEVENLERSIAIRIFNKLETLKENPSATDVKKLKGQEMYRMRVGDYRIIFSIVGKDIIIWKVSHRKNVYEQ